MSPIRFCGIFRCTHVESNFRNITYDVALLRINCTGQKANKYTGTIRSIDLPDDTYSAHWVVVVVSTDLNFFQYKKLLFEEIFDFLWQKCINIFDRTSLPPRPYNTFLQQRDEQITVRVAGMGSVNRWASDSGRYNSFHQVTPSYLPTANPTL